MNLKEAIKKLKNHHFTIGAMLGLCLCVLTIVIIPSPRESPSKPIVTNSNTTNKSTCLADNQNPDYTEKPFYITNGCVIINSDIIERGTRNITRECAKIASYSQGGNGMWDIRSSCVNEKSIITLTYRDSGFGKRGVLVAKPYPGGFYIKSFTYKVDKTTSEIHMIDNHEDNNDIFWRVTN